MPSARRSRRCYAGGARRLRRSALLLDSQQTHRRSSTVSKPHQRMLPRSPPQGLTRASCQSPCSTARRATPGHRRHHLVLQLNLPLALHLRRRRSPPPRTHRFLLDRFLLDRRRRRPRQGVRPALLQELADCLVLPPKFMSLLPRDLCLKVQVAQAYQQARGLLKWYYSDISASMVLGRGSTGSRCTTRERPPRMHLSGTRMPWFIPNGNPELCAQGSGRWKPRQFRHRSSRA